MIHIAAPSSSHARRSLTPRIHWGGHTQTLDRFPTRGELEQRCRARAGGERRAQPIDAFGQALAAASVRVWVLDLKFDSTAVAVLHDGIIRSPHLSGLDIRILSEQLDHSAGAAERADRILRQLRAATKRLPRLVWWLLPDKRLFPFAHDRFCVVDHELFHFGGTVGGAVPQLTAASSGWDAEAVGAIEFYERLWDAMGER